MTKRTSLVVFMCLCVCVCVCVCVFICCMYFALIRLPSAKVTERMFVAWIPGGFLAK